MRPACKDSGFIPNSPYVDDAGIHFLISNGFREAFLAARKYSDGQIVKFLGVFHESLASAIDLMLNINVAGSLQTQPPSPS